MGESSNIDVILSVVFVVAVLVFIFFKFILPFIDNKYK